LQFLGGGYEKKSLEPAAPVIYRRSALAFLFSKATTTLKNQNLAYLIGYISFPYRRQLKKRLNNSREVLYG